MMTDTGSTKVAIVSLVLVFLAAMNIVSQEPARVSFSELDKEVGNQQGGWAGDKQRLSTVFDNERKRLGDRFEAELLKYLDGNAERHYWISFFLEEPSYLHGNKPLPYLSLLVMQQGLSLLRGKSDEESIGLTVSLNVIAAVLSKKLGLTHLAIAYKTDAERSLSGNPDLNAYFPAMSEDESKIYESLPGTRRSSPLDDEFRDMPKARVHGGLLNDRATRLPPPVYPAGVREIRGQVIVSIVFDEAGKVIWVHATSGPPALRKVAEDAARKAEFKPFMLEGKPERVVGVLIYQFVNE